MSKIFVRQRRHVGEGAGQPRFSIVAVQGADIKIYARHIRVVELEKLAEETGLEIVYLPRGEQAEGEGMPRRKGGGRRQRRPAED